MNRPFILGVDPGLTGAMALYSPSTRTSASMCDMPLRKHPSFETNRKMEIDIPALSYWLDEHAPQIDFAVIEEVNAMPGQGVTSMFRFGEALGIIKGVITSFMIPVHHVRPSVWKQVMHLGKDKEESINKANALFGHLFTKKKDHGKAEALLLAVYGSLYCSKT